MEMVKTNGHKLRRSIFWLVLLGGITTLAVLFLYYSGYRFDWKQGRFIQLGSIAVNIQPEESSVYLNGELMPKQTPAIFNSIKPGEYTLRIEHEGYSSAELAITVHSKSATVINNLFLPPIGSSQEINQPDVSSPVVSQKQLEAVQELKDWPIWSIAGTDPVAIISGPDRQLSLVQNKKEIKTIDTEVTDVDVNPELNQVVYAKKSTAWIVYSNFEPLKSFILSRQTAPFKEVLLVPQMQAVILTDQELIQLVEVGPNESVIIFKLASGENLHNTQFDPTGKILWFQDADQWYQLELFK